MSETNVITPQGWWDRPHPEHPIWPPQPWPPGPWPGQGCGPPPFCDGRQGACSCGTMYKGPGHGCCQFCMTEWLTKQMKAIMADPSSSMVTTTITAINAAGGLDSGASTGISGPIIGVTDGSNAGPGEVGEFLTASSNFSFAAYPAQTNQTLSLIVLPPGDWDIWTFMYLSVPTGVATMYVSPLPTGLSNEMFVQAGSIAGSTAQNYQQPVGPYARGSFAVPTLIPMVCAIYQDASGLTAGTATVNLEARRRR